jgi:carboxymethylenebutenolidase
MMRDTQGAIYEAKSTGPVACVGFCIGDTVAFLAATRLNGLAPAICYYGARIAVFADEKPRCLAQMHFGAKDESSPMTDVEIIKQKRPDCELYIYPDAGHDSSAMNGRAQTSI